MKVKDIYILLDDCTQLYICDISGHVIETIQYPIDNVIRESGLMECEVVNITTYNYGIEVDVDIETE